MIPLLPRVAMRVFHQTEKKSAAAIISEGFIDNEEKYLSDFAWRGVWVCDRPPRGEENASDRALLTLDIPAELFAVYEWLPEDESCRGSLIPAAILNRYGPPRTVRG